MADIRRLHRMLVTRILEGDGSASGAQRRAAFEGADLAEPLRGLIRKTAKKASAITDEDIAAVKASGLSDNQIFELVVCAAVGQATRHYQGAVAALKAAVED